MPVYCWACFPDVSKYFSWWLWVQIPNVKSWKNSKKWSGSISRVLSRTIIHLGLASPQASSNLPESSAGRANGFLFGLAPNGVYHAADCYQLRGALLPHLFTLTGYLHNWRFAFCCTFRRLAPPRRYLAFCPMEPGLSSPVARSDCLTHSRRAPYQIPGENATKNLIQQAFSRSEH